MTKGYRFLSPEMVEYLENDFRATLEREKLVREKKLADEYIVSEAMSEAISEAISEDYHARFPQNNFTQMVKTQQLEAAFVKEVFIRANLRQYRPQARTILYDADSEMGVGRIQFPWMTFGGIQFESDTRLAMEYLVYLHPAPWKEDFSDILSSIRPIPFNTVYSIGDVCMGDDDELHERLASGEISLEEAFWNTTFHDFSQANINSKILQAPVNLEDLFSIFYEIELSQRVKNRRLALLEGFHTLGKRK